MHFYWCILWRRGWESNPRMKVLQTSPFPLGYRASEGQYSETSARFQPARGLSPAAELVSALHVYQPIDPGQNLRIRPLRSSEQAERQLKIFPYSPEVFALLP